MQQILTKGFAAARVRMKSCHWLRSSCLHELRHQPSAGFKFVLDRLYLAAKNENLALTSEVQPALRLKEKCLPIH